MTGKFRKVSKGSKKQIAAKAGTCLHLGFSVDLEIVQSLLGHSGAGFVCILHESDVFLCRNKTDFQQVRVSEVTKSVDDK